MQKLITFFLSFVVLSILSQEKIDYIVKLNNDTVLIKGIKMDSKIKNVICEEKGRKIKYRAKDILAVKIDTLFYMSALVRLKRSGSKKFVFLQKTISGYLSLYEINVKRSKFLWKAFGGDLIHLRWVYRAHDWIKDVVTTVYFYKKENEAMKNLSRNWKMKTKDCKLLHEKINSKTIIWNPSQREIVKFYNANL